jgi:hypothetical protein
MTVYVGGLRARLIKDSCYFTLVDALTTLGWFDPTRRHQPITMVAEQQDLTVEIPLNTLALFAEGRGPTLDWELGSTFSQHSRLYYVDFFAESDALGEHVIEDVRDILEGRMPSIGRADPIINVMDYTQATPTQLFYVDVEGVRQDRAHNFPQPYLRHWFSLQFTLTDYYGDELDA